MDKCRNCYVKLRKITGCILFYSINMKYTEDVSQQNQKEISGCLGVRVGSGVRLETESVSVGNGSVLNWDFCDGNHSFRKEQIIELYTSSGYILCYVNYTQIEAF